jgi:hypothetical protein
MSHLLGSLGKGGVQTNQYRMSLHYGFCAEIDGLSGIYSQDKTVWEGWMTDSGLIVINQPTLWSAGQWDVTAKSAASAGGPVGNMYVLIGDSAQTAPQPLANRLGWPQATCPAYRGLFTLFFCSTDNTDGFLWINNVPDVPGIQAKCYRMPVTPMDAGAVMIPARGFAAERSLSDGWNDDRYDQNGIPINNNNGGTTYGSSIPDANPAYILYEVLTNGTWGMGIDSSLLDTPTFQAAGYTLLGEQLGLSVKWTSQDSIDTMVADVLATIQGVLYVSPITGLFTLKLLRNDYVVASLPIMTQSNGKVTSFTRRLLGETHNCVSIAWTNPLTESNDSVMAFDPGGISRQGGCIVQANSYSGVRNEILALELAMRDLQSAAAPLAIFEVEVDRTFWGTSPGDCIVVNYPEYGISGMVCRVTKVDYGQPGASVIKINMAEDIFSFAAISYQGVTKSLWSYKDRTLRPVTNAKVYDLPYYAADRSNTYPESTLGIFAQAPASNTSVFQIYSDVTDILGNVTVDEIGSDYFIPAGNLGTTLVAEVTSTGVVLGVSASALDFVIFGTTETEQEICIVSDVVVGGTTTVVLWRGLLDTVPRAWPVGTPFFVSANMTALAVGGAYAAGSPVTFQLCPMVDGRVLQVSSAPFVIGNPLSRQNLPTRPAKVCVGGTTYFGTYTQATTADIAVTWANRNRLTEDLTLLPWSAASIPPEDGQTTSIELWSADLATMLWTATGLTGTSGTVPYSAFGGAPAGYVRVLAVNEGLTSLQGLQILANVPSAAGGYGEIYGYSYGET